MSKSTNNAATEAGTPPLAKIRVGLITASIWKRSAENGTFHSVTFDRRYRDAEGTWKSSNSYDAGDVLALAKAADLAHTKILQLREDA